MRVLAMMALLLFLTTLAEAEGLSGRLLEQAGLPQLEAISQAFDGPDVRAVAGAVMSGGHPVDEALMVKTLRRAGLTLKQALLQALSALAMPLLVSFALKVALGQVDGALTLLCRLACVYAMAQQSAVAMRIAEAAMQTSAQIADRVSPVIAATLTLTGRAASAAALTPLSALCVNLIENVLVRYGLPLCATACAIAAGASLSDQFRLDRLFDLVCRGTRWALRWTVAAFVGLLTLQGRLVAPRDGISVQAVQQALKGLIPFVGGSISDSSAALKAAATSVRNTMGVAGMLICAWVAARPLLRLCAHMLSLKLAVAVCEPMADSGIMRIVANYSEISRLLLALCACSVMLATMLAGACLAFSGQ